MEAGVTSKTKKDYELSRYVYFTYRNNNRNIVIYFIDEYSGYGTYNSSIFMKSWKP